MSEFDMVRRRKQGQAAKERVLSRLSHPQQQEEPVSEFDSIRNRSASMSTAVEAARTEQLPSAFARLNAKEEQSYNADKTQGAIDQKRVDLRNSEAFRRLNAKEPEYQSAAPKQSSKSFGQKVMGALKDIGQGLADFPDAFTNTASFGGTDAFARGIGQETKAQQAARDSRLGGKIGTYAGYVGPGGAADAVGNLLVRPLVKNAPAIVRGAARFGAGGLIFGGAQETGEALTGQNNQTLGERAIDIGVSGAIGAGFGAAGPLFKAGLQKGAQAVGNSLRGVQGAQMGAVDSVMRSDLPRTAKRGGLSNKQAPLQPMRGAVEPKPINGGLKPMKPADVPLRAAQEAAPTSQVIDDVANAADDIHVPEPDEVSTRLRDRLNSTADDWITQAKSQWQSKNRLGITAKIEDPDIAIAAKMAAGYMMKGTVKLADVTETLVREFGEEIRPHARKIFTQAKPLYQQFRNQSEGEALGVTNVDATKLKDLSNINLNTGDVNRNFSKVFGERFSEVKKSILDPFDAAKGEYATEQKTLTDKLYNEVVKGLGIRKGSKESALVQKFGEKQITLDELKQQAPSSWQKIVQADQWFRGEYDLLIDRVNKSVAQIYPNTPEKLVPKRTDYYRHFQEMKDWGGLKNLFDTSSGKISPSLSGLSPYTQPKTKWASFKQQRGLGEFKNDAVGGFLEYIPAASYAVHIDPHIAVFRNLGKRLAADTEKSANVNNFIKYLNNYANDLAGKTSPFDRWVEELGGRNALRVLTKVNNRVKKNVIMGNVRSTLSQLANIPNGIAYGGVDAPAGAMRTIESIWSKNDTMAKSAFLRERYLDKSFRRFDQKFWEQPERFAGFMMEATDRIGTSFVWNTAYAKGLRKKVANPVQFADEQTRKLVGGRGVGEQPLLIKSKVFNLIAPFQLEVNNLWRVMKGFVDEKRFGALVTLFVSNWLLNKAFEKTTGSGVVFDPIDAIYDASTAKDASILQRGGRLGGEVLSNVPFGQHVAAMYPEFGTNMYGMELPTREKLFGDKDPTRFGTGLLATNAVTDPLFKFILPFGGNQLKKSIQGTDALLRGGSYTENVLTTGKNIESPKLKYEVNPTVGNVLRGVAFGPNATSGGQDYNNNDKRPLSEKQTTAYLNSPNKTELLTKIQRVRDIDSIKAEINKIKRDRSMSDAQKVKEVKHLVEKLQELTAPSGR